MNLHKHRIVPIISIKKESPHIKSFVFDDNLCAKSLPGQFAMIWIPGIDEIPMSLMRDPKTHKPMIIVKKIGEATEALHRLSQNELLGIRGPYGTHFKIDGFKHIIAFAGGTGIAPLLQIILESKQKNCTVDLVLGANTKNEVLFKRFLDSSGCSLHIITEDGSIGKKGLMGDFVSEIVTKKHDLILCCGPELMIHKVINFAVTKKIQCQASLERIMKCGVGICGSCEISGFRVCKEGPVFESTELYRMLDTLGNYKRDMSGKKIQIQ